MKGIECNPDEFNEFIKSSSPEFKALLYVSHSKCRSCDEFRRNLQNILSSIKIESDEDIPLVEIKVGESTNNNNSNSNSNEVDSCAIIVQNVTGSTSAPSLYLISGNKLHKVAIFEEEIVSDYTSKIKDELTRLLRG